MPAISEVLPWAVVYAVAAEDALWVIEAVLLRHHVYIQALGADPVALFAVDTDIIGLDV
jgi:hypothetical protein